MAADLVTMIADLHSLLTDIRDVLDGHGRALQTIQDALAAGTDLAGALGKLGKHT